MEDQSMHAKKRMTHLVALTSTLVLGGALLAAAAEANDRHRGERINRHLDFLAIVAAFSGDPILAYALDQRGDRIERSYSRFDGHGARG
jgi:hypothetical protein